MFSKINTKYFLYVFLVLLTIVLITIPIGNKKKSRSFKSELTSFDTSKVVSLNIYPKGGGSLITFTKKGGNWSVSDKNGEYNANNAQLKNMLQTLSELKAKRLAAKGKDSWRKYEVTDSLATRVEVLTDRKVVADVYIGKFSYSQPSQANNPYQRQQGSMTSFVRLSDEKDVFAVEGFLSMTFNRQIKDFRDGKVIQVQKDAIQQLAITQPKQNYTLIKNDNSWLIDGLEADSVNVTEFLSGLSNLRSSNFVQKENIPLGAPNYTLKIAGENGVELAVVNAYYTDSTNIVLKSSMNPGTLFDGTKAELFTKLFKEKSAFIEN